MIRNAVKCDKDHSFESWFADSATFDRLQKSGHLACAVCGVSHVSKAIMAPSVSTGHAIAPPAPSVAAEVPSGPLSAPASPAEQALRALRQKVESEADFVGSDFATEARAMHDGEIDDRPIWGQASADEVKDLIKDDVPIMPLPFGPTKAN